MEYGFGLKRTLFLVGFTLKTKISQRSGLFSYQLICLLIHSLLMVERTVWSTTSRQTRLLYNTFEPNDTFSNGTSYAQTYYN